MWPETDLTRLRHMLDAATEAVDLGGGRSEEQLAGDRTASLALVRFATR